MEHLVKPTQEPRLGFALPPCVARYSPVFWEPLPGTSERVVALVAIEPHEDSTIALTAATHVVIPAPRLRAMFGAQRAANALGVLKTAAQFMTERQRAGLPLEELKAPFRGFFAGPTHVARAYSTEQLLDAAVRSVSAFGSSDGLLDEQEGDAEARHTVMTAEFLRSVKRGLAGSDDLLKSRFDKRLDLDQGAPVLTIDYAWKHWLVQVTSLPQTIKQAANVQREAQSKLLELDLARRAMQGNSVSPVLLVNQDALSGTAGEFAVNQALAMQHRLQQLAALCGAEILAAKDVGHGVQLLANLG